MGSVEAAAPSPSSLPQTSSFTPSLQPGCARSLREASFSCWVSHSTVKQLCHSGRGVGHQLLWQKQGIDPTCALMQRLFISRGGGSDSLLLQHIPISNIIHCTVLSATAKGIQKSDLKKLILDSIATSCSLHSKHLTRKLLTSSFYFSWDFNAENCLLTWILHDKFQMYLNL